ncbi:MAG: hypothetical protein HY362_04000 [Candidatus Aenigmarchaeota archaeon]|nr:hypothetical protein [Candidatus Aenigmarchaeota archaeon]
MEKKRLTAKKAGIEEIVKGKFVKKSGFESSYIITSLGRRMSRIRTLGLIVDKFVSEDGNYGSITLDDGSDTLRCKVFVNIKMLEGFKSGDLVDVTGKVREYNGEVYLAPEIIRGVTSNFETLRVLELKKLLQDQRKKISIVHQLQKQAADLAELKVLAGAQGVQADDVEAIHEAQELIEQKTEENVLKETEVKDKVLVAIESLDKGSGAEYSAVAKSLAFPEPAVDSAISALLEDGICFEPRAGFLKKI